MEHFDTKGTDGRQIVATRRTTTWHKCLIVRARGAVTKTFEVESELDEIVDLRKIG